MDVLARPWPWYIAGPLVGLMVPALLYIGNKSFGVSSSLRHICAATVPGKVAYLRYDWKAEAWNLLFVAGIVAGAYLASTFFANPETTAISSATSADLAAMGIADQSGLVPASLFNWGALGSAPGLVLMVLGGFLVGFGARYAGGCTSGHAITGLASLQLPSLIAVLGFFAGGLLTTHALLPLLLGGAK